MLQHCSFDELLRSADPSKWDAASVSEGWSGLVLRRETPSAEPVFVSAVASDQPTVLPNELSAVVCWFSPTSWSSPAVGGKGPGSDAHLLQWMWTDGQQATICWTLLVGADGLTSLSGLTQSGGMAEVLKADVAWEAGCWYCVAIYPEPERTRLLINGECVAEGPPLTPVNPAQCRLVVGSDRFGAGMAGGLFDEVNVLGRSRWARRDLAADVANHWQGLAEAAARGPISLAEEEATRNAMARSAFEGTGAPMAMSMASSGWRLSRLAPTPSN